MAIPVLILGQSGMGKSASLRNFPEKEYALINVMGKPLPFKSNKKFLETSDYARIKQAFMEYSDKVDSLVVDDAGYLITNQFMMNHSQITKGNSIFDLYNSLGDNFYRLLRYIVNDMPKDKIVYIFMHEDRDEFGYVKPKTIGRMLDEKVNISGLFTIILRATKLDGKYVFTTQTDGLDVTKTPIGMFDQEYIENDLYSVHKEIKKYYNIGEKENETNS
jgi:hypothetical protein